MKQILYSKYNRDRKKSYQLETTLIRERDGSTTLCKRALVPQAEDHIKKIYENHQILTNRYGEEHTIKVRIIEDNYICFELVEGQKWSEKLLGLIEGNDRRLFFDEMNKYYDFLIGAESNHYEKENNMFKDPYAENRTMGIKMDLGNIIIHNGIPKFINYEWLYPDIPKSFLLFYSIAGLREGLKLNELFSIEDILVYFELSQSTMSAYAKMEHDFLNSIMAPQPNAQYLKERLPFQLLYQKLSQNVLNSAVMKNAINKVLPLLVEAQHELMFINNNLGKSEMLFQIYRQLSQIGTSLAKVHMVFANQKTKDLYGYSGDMDLIIKQCDYLRDCLKQNMMPDTQLLKWGILPSIKNLIEKMNVARLHY